MSVYLSISLTGHQYRFAQSLIASGQYPDLDAVIQHGLELLRQGMKEETAGVVSLSQLISHRLKNTTISAEEMKSRVDELICRKRRLHGGDGADQI